jgi:hypothetical protein
MMTPWHNTASEPDKSTGTLPPEMRLMLLFMALLIWMSCSGCKTRVVVVPDSEVVTFVSKGETFTPPTDGVFMADGLYRRYRQAVSDRILETQQTQSK